jgi:hypothetical protein
MNIEDLEKILNNSEKKIKNINKDYTILVKKLSLEDPRAKEYYYDTLDPLEREYRIYNDRYKELISHYSLAYLELSEWYVGEYLPYHIFIKEIKGSGTFLDSKEDVKELYKLFIFMFLFECSLGKIIS